MSAGASNGAIITSSGNTINEAGSTFIHNTISAVSKDSTLKENKNETNITMDNIDTKAILKFKAQSKVLELGMRKRRRNTTCITAFCFALVLMICIPIGIGILARSQRAYYLCEGILIPSLYYTSPFIVVSNCSLETPSHFLASQTFCVNLISKSCVDVSTLAHDEQVAGLILLFFGLGPMVILFLALLVAKAKKKCF